MTYDLCVARHRDHSVGPSPCHARESARLHGNASRTAETDTAPRRARLGLALLVTCACSPPAATIDVVAFRREVVADDGYTLAAFDLHLAGEPQNAAPEAWMYYLIGSEPVSLIESTAQFADLVAQGIRVVLLQPRGVRADGTVDEEVYRQYHTRQRRVGDQLAVMDAYIDDTDVPVLLVGTSEGGVVAADVAAQDPRVTHLLMMASGGGWSFAQELAFLVEKQPGSLGMPDVAALEAKLADVRAEPDSNELWAGHTFRYWSSFIDFRPADVLTTLSIPIFLAHGSADRAVPVESARALDDRFTQLGLTHLTYVEYADLDHHFADENGMSRLVDLQQDAYAWMMQTGFFP